MKKIYLILALGFFTCSSYFAHAHHSFAATFAAGEKITIEGVVTNWSFKNPHVLVTVAVENPDGSTTEWVSEGAAATNMRRLGWSADTFSEGDLIRVTGDRTHDGSPMTSIDLVEFLDANGNVVKTMNESEAEIAGGNADGAPAGRPNNLSEKAAPMDLTLADGTTPNLTGAWTRHGMGFGPPQRPTATYTEAGEKAQALFTEVVDPQVFCDNPGLLRQAGMTPHPVRITQYDDRVEFAWEEYGGSRTVYFDERDFKGYRTHLGDGIARYEDGKLIIETHNLLTDPGSPEGDLTSHNVTFTEIYEREDSEQFGPAIRITGIAVDPDWLDGEMVYSGIKMSAGEYEFIENDCQTPLRERVAVHASMSHFVTSTPWQPRRH